MHLIPRRGLAVLLMFLAGGAVVWAGTLAQFRTPLGDLDVELFDQDKPVTTANFIRYVRAGVWQDMFIHRWESRFVIQGGGFFVTNRHTAGVKFAQVPVFGEIANEYSAGRILSNTYGTLAMARVGGKTNSATSQWFFNLTNNAFLDLVDGGFTVFGRVVRGTHVLERFNNPSTNNGIFVADAGAPLNALPVLSRNPTFEDLVYVDILLLNVQVQPAPNGGREISWNSVSNVLNVVEFTTPFPPDWQPLASTNGSGGLLRVTDTEVTAPARFYRVRVDY